MENFKLSWAFFYIKHQQDVHREKASRWYQQKTRQRTLPRKKEHNKIMPSNLHSLNVKKNNKSSRWWMLRDVREIKKNWRRWDGKWRRIVACALKRKEEKVSKSFSANPSVELRSVVAASTCSDCIFQIDLDENCFNKDKRSFNWF